MDHINSSNPLKRKLNVNDEIYALNNVDVLNNIDALNNVDVLNNIDALNNVDENKLKRQKINFSNFFDSYFNREYIEKVENIFGELFNNESININSFSDYVKSSIIYYCIRYLSYLKSLNEISAHNKEYNNNKSKIVESLNCLKKKIYESIENKKKLIKKIYIVDNEIDLDINNIQKLSNDLLSINLQNISNINTDNTIDKNIPDLFRINCDISLLNKRIEINSDKKEKLQKELNIILEDCNNLRINFNKFYYYFVNNNKLNNKIFSLSNNLNLNSIILKIIKHRLLLKLNDDTKNKFTNIFLSFKMYNSILNNISINEDNANLFDKISNDIKHYDKNSNSCYCSNRCNKIGLFKKIYHELLEKYDTRNIR